MGPGPGPPPKRASHHIHVFNYMCDMCMPLSHFSKKNLFVDAINYISRAHGSILQE